jgi:tellurite resistance protein TehA-like permease
MSHDSSWIMIIIGAVFLALSAVCFSEARSEDKHLDSTLSRRPDVREFVLGPIHIESAALRWGAWIFIILAVILIIMGIVYLTK